MGDAQPDAFGVDVDRVDEYRERTPGAESDPASRRGSVCLERDVFALDLD